MKLRLFSLIVVVIISLNIKAQIPYNLVPNYSFENTINCAVSSGGGGSS